MAIQGGYLPPGVYTSTTFETQNQNTPQLQGRIPTLIGVGRQTIKTQGSLVVRGSSATIDQRIVEEDMTGRMISGENPDGSLALSGFDGLLNKVLVRNFPIVTGDGSGSTLNNPTSIVATLNGNAVVVLGVDGANGTITLAEAPKDGDDLRVSYFFNRTDTFVENEDLSAQVSGNNTELYGSASSFVIDSSSNTLILTVDGVTRALTLPNGAVGDRAASLGRVVATLNAANLATLEASTYIDVNGSENLFLSAEGSIVIGAGTANSAIGVYANQQGSERRRTFFTHFGPIVDGTNGGVTTTEPSYVSVLVDGVEVVPTSLDGANNSFTLALPPKVGASVSVSYYHNTFKDQFDYLPGRDITSIDRVSLVASGGGASAQFIEDIDFVLHDDKIVWGTASLVSNGAIQEGETAFGVAQATSFLRDEKVYLAECARVVNTSVIPARTLNNVFQLPFQPTDGSGTGTPSNRTDLVVVRTGVSLSDALENPQAVVTRVNPLNSQITLASDVPASHKVFATFYYSTIQDRFNENAYVMSVVTPGASGIGTYSVKTGTRSLFSAEYQSKGIDLTEITLNFPSGSEAISGARMGSGTPVEETITLEIENFQPTPAVFTSGGFGPYYLVDGASSALEISVDGQAVSMDFANPTLGGRLGHVPSMVSGVLPYAPETNNTTFEDGISSSMTLEVDGLMLDSASISGNGLSVDSWVNAINAEANLVAPTYTSMSPISSTWGALNAGTYLAFQFAYTGDSTASTTVSVQLGAQNFLSAEDLVNHINNQIFAGIALVPALNGLDVSVELDSRNRLVFTLNSIAGADASFGYIEFVSDGATDTSFLSIAGIDGDVSANGTQTKWGYLPVASKVSTDLGNGELRDRLILKSRTFSGNKYYAPNALGVTIFEGSNLTYSGFNVGDTIVASRTSVIDAPSITLDVSWDEESNGLPAKTFYDGTGVEDQNNVLTIDVGGTALTTSFNASGAGTLVSADDIVAALNVSLNGYASAHLEGRYIRIVSDTANLSSYLTVSAGSANASFGVEEGTTSSAQSVPASALVGALMSNMTPDISFSDVLFTIDPSADSIAGKYAEKAVAYLTLNETGKEYVTFESLSTGVASSLDVTGGSLATTKGSGLKITTASGAVGEASAQGFFVTSSNPSGTGSANTSVLNDGVGADGKVGQTYVDEVTGFTFTLLAREGGLAYPTGADARLTFKVSKTFTTNANVPNYAIPGVALVMSNTLGTLAGDTALLETFFKGGSEPRLGQEYYVDFTRVRSLFNTRTFTNLADVVATYGPVSLENTLSLGAYLAFANGAIAVACKQVPLEANQTQMTEDQVISALVDIEGEIVPGLSPSVITPLYPATPNILSALSNHCDLQSSIRYRSERRAVVGVAPGTQPRDVQNMAEATANSRIVIVYPDMANLSFTDDTGTTQSYLVGGEFVAVALANATSNPSLDAATPWTGRTVRGFSSLARNLDEVDANATANKGVTILTQKVDGIKVRHGLTTNMTSVITKTPTVIQIADHVQVRARNLLARYIGVKYVPQTIQQIEGQVNTMFKQLVRDQIISTYTGLSLTRDANDPTQLNIEAFYKPVYPLLYIQFNFTVRGG
jgi:hypothetical protein